MKPSGQQRGGNDGGRERSVCRDIQEDLVAYLQVWLLKLSNTDTQTKLRGKKMPLVNTVIKFSVVVHLDMPLGGKTGGEKIQ